jgi:uncharacterized protein YecE (DUF72 family)
MSAAATRYWIGPSGWRYPDWDGIVYPAQKPRGFKPLVHIARYFNAVEVNTSFYRIPAARMTQAWPGQVPEGFRFAFKLTQTFTHERGAFPDAAEVRAFHDGVAPVREAGKLGPLLVQFPWSFRFAPGAADWLLRLADAFADFDRFVEVRHASWATDAALDTLRRVGGYCNIDQPVLRDCLGPTAHVFGRAAYVRLHGRNAKNWFAQGQPGYERYNYTYTEAELREWAARITRLGDEAEEVYVFANNHYRGQGPLNALELMGLLQRAPVDVPAELLAAYPRLAAVARPQPPTSLFGGL